MIEETEDIATAPEGETAPSISLLGAEGLHEFIRYVVASAIALGIDTGLLWFLTSIVEIPYLLSGAIAFIAGLVTIYFLSVLWVFQNRMLRNWGAEFLLFGLIGVVGLGLNELILFILTGSFGLYYLFSKGASVIVVFAWNFAARKWLLFRTDTRA